MRTFVGLSVLVLLVSVSFSIRADAFANVKVGEKVKNTKLPNARGGKHPVLGKATVNVFLFFRPGSRNSRLILKHVAAIERAFTGKSVRWVAIAPGHFTTRQILADTKAVGLKMPILVDKGDVFYGKLGVALHPVLGITDKNHRLTAYQHFTKINFRDVLIARIRHGLKEIDDKALELVINPAKKTHNRATAKARRYMKFARKLLKLGKSGQALIYAKKAIDKAPKYAPAHVLVGEIFVVQKKCSLALACFKKALALDPKNSAARAGKRRCKR